MRHTVPQFLHTAAALLPLRHNLFREERSGFRFVAGVD